MNQSTHCLIAGAGIGGLTCAIALAKQGLSVELVEQAPKLNDVGAGIQLSPNAMHVFSALGLSPDLLDRAFQPTMIALRDYRSSKAILKVPIKRIALERYGQPYLHIHRADLLEILVTKAQKLNVKIHLGYKVVNYQQTTQQVELVCNTKTFLGDLLIGADGINSAVRTTMLGIERPRFTGQVAWRGIVPAAALKPGLIPPDANSWLGPGGHFVSYYLRRGELINFVAVQERAAWSEESWHVKGDVSQLRRAFADWNTPVTKLLEACEQCFLWGLFDRKPQAKWCDARVTLLGDACHAMLPFVAQGAAMAIEDAYVLSRCISANRSNIADGFATYQATRKPRTTRLQKLSRQNATTFHLRNKYRCLIRNGKFALANSIPALAYSQLDPIFKTNVTESLS